MIVELPQIVRNSFKNMLIHFLYFSSKPNFEPYFNKHNQELEKLLASGLTIENRHYDVRIFAVTADSPARSKFSNAMQYNGRFGCINCVILTTKIGANGPRVYKNSLIVPIRTQNDYLQHVKMAQDIRKDFLGIKGPCYWSKFFTIPDNCLLDPMHLIFEGVVKRLLTIFLQKETSGKLGCFGRLRLDFVLVYQLFLDILKIGSSAQSRFFNDLLKNIKYPTEINGSNYLTAQLSFWKASEYRNFAYYAAPVILIQFLKDHHNYFKHFMFYVTAIRLLSKDDISKDDIRSADLLLRVFINQFEELYGEDELTFNLHSHIHLPLQVARFGPITKLSCFAFEGLIGMCKINVHGNRGFGNQINKFIQINRYLSDNSNVLNSLKQTPLSSFINKIKPKKCQQINKLSYLKDDALINRLLVSANISLDEEIFVKESLFIKTIGNFLCAFLKILNLS